MTIPASRLRHDPKTQATAPERVSFPTEDGGIVHADVYGRGDRGVVLVHGGRFNKESWEKQARVLVAGPKEWVDPDFWNSNPVVRNRGAFDASCGSED